MVFLNKKLYFKCFKPKPLQVSGTFSEKAGLEERLHYKDEEVAKLHEEIRDLQKTVTHFETQEYFHELKCDE